VQRSRIANLPAGVDPAAGFNDPGLRQAFIAYTTHVVKNYNPDYLAIGVEINMLYERNRPQFDAFVSLYKEAYDAARHNNSHTKVFPTFQLEDLEGTFADIHPPHWEVLDFFRGKMDALAISTYPFLSGIRSATDIPPDYYSQLKSRWDGEILIAETGHTSAPVEGHTTAGTEEDQQAYLTRILTDADRLGFSLVVWYAALDPAYANAGAASVFRDIGLRRSDGGNKLAWATWEEWARRPLKR
jgi:arabinogalactan endo-1,4-beta-galactosidase